MENAERFFDENSRKIMDFSDTNEEVINREKFLEFVENQSKNQQQADVNISFPSDEEISNEAEELNAPKNEKGVTIWKYAFDDDQQYAFEEGAKWMREEVRKRLVIRSGLSESEYKEREQLLELQQNKTRWFSQEEFNRLKELSNKMFAHDVSRSFYSLIDRLQKHSE